HTRWPRDWSSDVCSSDLHQTADVRQSQGWDPRDAGSPEHSDRSAAQDSRVGRRPGKSVAVVQRPGLLTAAAPRTAAAAAEHRRGGDVGGARGAVGAYASIFENRHAPASTKSTPTPTSTATSNATPKCVLPVSRPRTPSTPYVSGSMRVSPASTRGSPSSG